MLAAKRRLSHPERLVLKHERKGITRLTVAAVACVTAATLTTVSYVAGGVVGAAALGVLLWADWHFRRARRAEVGVYSERETSQALAPLQRRGWTVEANVVFPGRGDIDHVVRAPGGPWFAIETKTARFAPRDLDRTLAAAHFVAARGRGGPVPTFAVLTTAARRGTTVEHGVTVCWTRNLLAVIDMLSRDYHAHTTPAPPRRRFGRARRPRKYAGGPPTRP